MKTDNENGRKTTKNEEKSEESCFLFPKGLKYHLQSPASPAPPAF